MIEILAWIGCSLVVLKGVEIFLSSIDDDFIHLRRRAALGIMIISLILAGLFTVMIVRERMKVAPLQEAYEETQKAVIKSFEATSRELETTTAPVSPSASKPEEDVIETMKEASDAINEDAQE